MTTRNFWRVVILINSCENPEQVMENYREGLALINSKKHYDEFANAVLFTLIRQEDGRDTKDEVLAKLAEHFGLEN